MRRSRHAETKKARRLISHWANNMDRKFVYCLAYDHYGMKRVDVDRIIKQLEVHPIRKVGGDV